MSDPDRAPPHTAAFEFLLCTSGLYSGSPEDIGMLVGGQPPQALYVYVASGGEWPLQQSG
jgi:hypothetical protein